MSDNKFDAPLTAIRKDMRAAIAACQGTGGLPVTGDLFKDWVALRSNWACNVDTTGTNAAAVTLDPQWTTTDYVPLFSQSAQSGQEPASAAAIGAAGAYVESERKVAAREITYGATNLCMAQKLNERFQGEDQLFLDASDQRLVLSQIRERSQLAMLQLSVLWQALALPGARFNEIPVNRVKTRAPFPELVQYWAYCGPKSLSDRSDGGACAEINLLETILPKGRAPLWQDLPAAIAIHSHATHQLLEMLAREASSRSVQGDRSLSIADRDFGRGSWRQRAAALLWGGDPLAEDETASWKQIARSMRGRLLYPAPPTSSTFWPGGDVVPFVREGMSEPRVALLRSKLRIAGGDVSIPFTSTGEVDTDELGARLYWHAEAAERTLRCTATTTANGVTSCVRFADWTAIPAAERQSTINALLRNAEGIELEHARAFARALVQATATTQTGVGVAPFAMAVPAAPTQGRVPMLFDVLPKPASTFQSGFASLVYASGVADFAPGMVERHASCFTTEGVRYSYSNNWTAATPPLAGDPQVSCGRSGVADERDLDAPSFGFQYAAHANNEAGRTMGAMPALAAVRAAMTRTRELYATSASPRPAAPPGLDEAFRKAIATIDAAIGPSTFVLRPETTDYNRFAWSGAVISHEQKPSTTGGVLWRAEVSGVPSIATTDEVFLDVYPPLPTVVDALALGGRTALSGAKLENGFVVGGGASVRSTRGTVAGDTVRFSDIDLNAPGGGSFTFALRVRRAPTAPSTTSTTSVELLAARQTVGGASSVTESAPIALYCMVSPCPTNNYSRALPWGRGFVVATGGTLGAKIETLWERHAADWSRPANDAFGLLTDWVPPLDPQLVGTAASSNSAQYYLARATAAADVARDATNTAFQTLLQSANDGQAKEIQARRSKEVDALEQRNLCGAGTTCAPEVTTFVPRTEATPPPCDEAKSKDPAVNYYDRREAIIRCVARSAYDAVNLPLPVLREASDALRAGASGVGAFQGGRLEGIVVRQVATVRRIEGLYKEYNQVVELATTANGNAKTRVAAADAARNRAGDSWLSWAVPLLVIVAVAVCVIFPPAAAALASGLGLTAGVAATVGSAAIGLALASSVSLLQQGGQALVDLARGESAYWAQVRSRYDNETNAAVEKSMAALLDVQRASNRLADEVASLGVLLAEADRAQAESKLVVARQNLEAELAVAGLQTSVGLYRRYHTYDVWRARAALENARREALTARRAIEARYVVDLSRMDAAEPYVAAPSSWADEIYDYDLSMPAAVGLSIGTPIPGGVYPYKIGDYVANLSSFVNGYPVSRPTAVNRREDDVITLEGPDQRVAGSTTVRTPAAAALWIARCEGTGPTAGSTLVCAGASTSGWCSIPDARSVAAACDALTGTTTRTVNVAPKALRARFQMDAWGRRAGTATDTPNRHNVRWSRFAVNLVGTGVRDCTRATDRTACFADGTVRYTLRQASRPWVSDYLGQWRVLGLGEGSTSSSRALANEQWLDVLTNGWDKPFVGAVAREELFERPVGGLYDLDLEVPAEVRPERIERVQILTQQTSWVAQTTR